MPEWRPINSPKRNTIIFCICGAVLLGIGIGVLYGAKAIHSVIIPISCDRNINCEIPMHLDEYFKGPVFLYYKFGQYFQNHRMFASSLSYDQMSGDNISEGEAESFCAPVIKMEDVGTLGSTTLNWTDVANPCGLAPKFFYNGSSILRHIRAILRIWPAH